jgi:hypothetical protein
MSSFGARGSEPFGRKFSIGGASLSPLVVNIASCDGSNQITGTGENQPEEPEGGLRGAAIVR